MELDEFRTELINDIEALSILNGQYSYISFLNYMRDFLSESGNASDLNECSYMRNARDRKYKTMKIDGYCIQPEDSSLILYLGEYDSDLTQIKNINTDSLNASIQNLYNYVENIVKGFFLTEDIEESSQIYQVSRDILTELANKNIDRVHLIFATTNLIGKKAKLKDIDPIVIKDRKLFIDVTTYDIEDLWRASMSDQKIEPIEIETKDFECINGIPCLNADLGPNSKYKAYLGIVPGIFLSSIYRKFGGKLLESNVRAFLNFKGTINKGIRNTILHEQDRFFTYNNGIACTADKIKLSEDGTRIIYLKNFQIVNGGQTTASLANSIIKDNAEENVRQIYVPMKLTVLSSPDPELVADIAKYANSQNKVSASDLVSNNKFYVQIEQLSRKILTPKTSEKNYQTYWYFERSRGQYDRDLFQKLKKSEKEKFKALNPKNQMFKKPDLAKYMNSYAMKPYIVAHGAEVNAAEFQKDVDTKYKNLDEINEIFYKELIAKAILFTQNRLLISQSEWYQENKGILAQVCPHIISKLVYEVGKIDNGKKLINLKEIWDKQSLSKPMIEELNRIGELVWSVISRDDRPFINIAEWCKRENCWNLVKNTKYELSEEFKKTLITEDDLKEEKQAAKKMQKDDNKVDFALEIFNRGAQYWVDLLERAKLEGVVGEREVSLLNAAIRACKKNYLLNNNQAAAIRKILDIFEQKGVYIK